MDARHVLTLAVCGRDLGDDLVERERGRIDHARAARCGCDQLARNERARVKADRTARDEGAAAHGDEIGSTRPRPDEVHRHRLHSFLAGRAFP